MASRNAIVEFLLDQLNGFGATPRRMFGGVALYRAGLMFGFVYQDRVYFKVDDRNRTDYESVGNEPLIYAPDKTAQRIGSLMELPAEVLEDSETLVEWAAKAVDAALAAKRG